MIIPLGGGGSKVVASIAVTYPAGSTLTCTLGSKVLTAKDTSGKWVFGLPSIGSWVVKATDGTKSKSQTVSIIEGDAKNITLTYNIALYTNGTENVAWTVKNSSYVACVKGTSNLVFRGTQNVTNDFAQIYTTSAVDLTGCNSISVKGSFIKGQKFCFGIFSNVPKDYYIGQWEGQASALSTITTAGDFTNSLDISSVSESIKSACYVALMASSYYSGTGDFATVSEVYAE